MSKINQMHETEIFQVDNDGIIVKETHTRTTTYNLGQEPPYIKMYLDTILYLQDIPQSCNGVLLALLKRMTYADEEDGQVIYTNSDMKKKIALSMGITISRLDNILSDLVKGEVFERVGRGTFKVNSKLFGKGEWKDIGKLRLQITFDTDGKTIKGEIERKNRKNENQMTLQEVIENESTSTLAALTNLNRTSTTNEPRRISVEQRRTIETRGQELPSQTA